MIKIAILVFLIAVPIVIYFTGKEGRRLFREALNLENEGKYESACFKYAETAREGAKKKKCQRRIQELNKEHGPFDFIQVERNNRDRFDCDSCSFAYHSEVVYFIKKTLGQEKSAA